MSTLHFKASNQSWSSRAGAVRGPCPCFLSLCSISNDFATTERRDGTSKARDSVTRWLEGFVDSTVLDHPALVLDRQFVQLFHVSREQCQHPIRDERLGQTRPSPDERRSQPVSATLLLNCCVVGLSLSFTGGRCAELAWHDASVVHDDAQRPSVLLVSQKLFLHHS